MTSDEIIGFIIENNIINTTQHSCVDNFVTAIRNCSNIYGNYNTVLICDYSDITSYEVDCTLQVTGAPVNTAITVHCVVGVVQSVGAGLIVTRK